MDWLDRGAHFYVYGDAKRMAEDVEKAVIEIVAAPTSIERPAFEAGRLTFSRLLVHEPMLGRRRGSFALCSAP